jgi:hypothetical protein
MQSILDKEQVVSGKIQQAKKIGQVRQLLEGGWI